MSIRAIQWAWQVKLLEPLEKLVLLAIADHADDSGLCWPGVRGIAAKCGITDRAVQQIVRLLEIENALLRTFQRYRTDGSQTSNLIVLNIRDLTFPEFLGCSQEELVCSPPGEQPFTPPVNTHSPHESSLEPSLKPNTTAKRRVSVTSEAFESFWSLYPKREGGNPKNRAYKAWCARLKQGVPADDMLNGTQRYATYCRVRGIEGTAFVKQAATFLGPDESFREEWKVVNGQTDAWWQSESATEAKAREIGLWPPRMGEQWNELRQRIREALQTSQ